MWSFLNGKKTYSSAGALMLASIAGVLAGDLSIWEAVIGVIAGIGIASARHAVTREKQMKGTDT